MKAEPKEKEIQLKPIFEVVRIKQEIRALEGDFLYESYTISSPEDCASLAKGLIGNEDREVFLVICLSTKNKVTAIHRAHIGSLNASIVHPRDVYKSAILNNSASIIVAHNHPGRDNTPSQEDKEVTKRLIEAGKILGIELLDHLIVTDSNFLSFKEKGYM